MYGHDLNVCDTNSQRAHMSFFVTLFIFKFKMMHWPCLFRKMAIVPKENLLT